LTKTALAKIIFFYSESQPTLKRVKKFYFLQNHREIFQGTKCAKKESSQLKASFADWSGGLCQYNKFVCLKEWHSRAFD
jgi:hypothetical protein